MSEPDAGAEPDGPERDPGQGDHHRHHDVVALGLLHRRHLAAVAQDPQSLIRAGPGRGQHRVRQLR